ncbi:M23 family peptidase [Fulvimarina endophytica]|uniref:M23 family peptidase n=1 Tax=Fulvimarina endophytica TaxID=2293836 RepID=A0A371WZC8_9HYPH|nr:M23 family metallopeptidase [Fulvimarina endophytica]RFC62337.1 M23 family peptidase [Fulvimarina endophytica]
MTATTGQRQSFGRRRQPITFVVARGETVRHITLERRHFVRSGFVAVICGLCLTAATYHFGPVEAVPAVPGESELRHSYELRLAELRTQLDEATSRQFVAQKMLESKVDLLLDQQEVIAERYERLEPLFRRARENGILPGVDRIDMPVPTPRPGSAADAYIKAEAEAGPGALRTPAATLSSTNRDADPQDAASQESPILDPLQTASLRQSNIEISPETLGDFREAIDVAELQQISNLRLLVSQAQDRTTQISSVLASVGIRPGTRAERGVGGPFEPVPDELDFDVHYAELDTALERLEGLRGLSEGLPFAAPMDASLMSSTFGVRKDPFLGRRALHAGIDYAVRTGTPVRATASGTVVRAKRAGGYGNLVEIDHGNDVRTRFGHLSRIDVKPGDKVERGQTIGAVGSTGRSTGPHLHYEIRRGKKAVDPMGFIRAGRKLETLS